MAARWFGCLRKCGTRLLATLAWLVLLACFWQLLPPRPRATLEDSEPHLGWSSRPYLDCFSPDGQTLVVTTEQSQIRRGIRGPIRLWDANTGRERYALVPDWRHVERVEFSPDGRLLAAQGRFLSEPAGSLKLWDVATGTERADLDAIPARYCAGCFSPDGRFFVLQRWLPGLLMLGPLDFWEVETGRVRASIPGQVECLQFAPDGRRLVIFHPNGYDGPQAVRVQLWALADAPPYLTLLKQYDRPYDRVVDRFASSPALDRFALATYWHTTEGRAEIKVYDLATGSVVASTIHRDPSARIDELSFSPDGRFLLAQRSGGAGPHTIVWEVSDGLRVARTSATQAVLSPDGRWFLDRKATGADLLSLPTFRQERTLRRPGDVHLPMGTRGSPDLFPACRFSRDSRRVAITGLWHPFRISAVGDCLAGRSRVPWQEGDTSVMRLWDVDSGSQVLACDGCIDCLLSPDGRTMATRHLDGHILLWDVPPRRPLPLILALTTASWAALVGLALLLGRWRRSRRPAAA